MACVKRSIIQKRQVDLLAFFLEESQARGEGQVAISLKAIAADRNLSPVQTRQAVASLKRAGYLEVIPRTMPNGGTAENAYRVTEAGRLVLRACRAAGVLEQEPAL